MDTDGYEPESKYLEAALINDVMLKDPAVKQFIYRKLKSPLTKQRLARFIAQVFIILVLVT